MKQLVIGSKTWGALGAVLAVLLICNLAFVHTSGWAKFGWTAFGYLALWGIYKWSQLKVDDIGLGPKHLKSGLKYGLVAVAIIAVGLLIVYAIHPATFQDNKYHQSLPSAVYGAIVLLPLKTILFEELAFRGVLLALLLKLNRSPAWAIFNSAWLFGLWHIVGAPAVGSVSISTGVSHGVIVAAVAAVTTVAGAVLAILRLRSQSLLAPILAHWAINGLAIILAALAWSR